MQHKITHIPKSALAMVGIIILIAQIAIVLPLHIASFFGFGFQSMTFILSLCALMLLPLPVTLTATFALSKQSSQLTLLRKQYRWFRWLWSPVYWIAYWKHISPYTPAWLAVAAQGSYLYTLVIGLGSQMLVLIALSKDLPFDSHSHHSLRFITSLFFQMNLPALAWSLGKWRESRTELKQEIQA